MKDKLDSNELNDVQLYDLYKSLPLYTIQNRSTRLYPKFVVITGRSISRPHPHRYYSFEEFIDVLYSERGDELRNAILS